MKKLVSLVLVGVLSLSLFAEEWGGKEDRARWRAEKEAQIKTEKAERNKKQKKEAENKKLFSEQNNTNKSYSDLSGRTGISEQKDEFGNIIQKEECSIEHEFAARNKKDGAEIIEIYSQVFKNNAFLAKHF